jgi:hypothetical protein
VATNVGGIAEVIGGENAKRLVKVGDISGLVAESLRLLTDASAYDCAADAARTRATSCFQRVGVIDHYVDIYRRVLSEP